MRRRGTAAVSGKWVRASARKKAFGSRSRQAKCSACPTQGWVKSPPHHRRFLSARRGDVVWFFPRFFRPLGSHRHKRRVPHFATSKRLDYSAAMGFCRARLSPDNSPQTAMRRKLPLRLILALLFGYVRFNTLLIPPKRVGQRRFFYVILNAADSPIFSQKSHAVPGGKWAVKCIWEKEKWNSHPTRQP